MVSMAFVLTGQCHHTQTNPILTQPMNGEMSLHRNLASSSHSVCQLFNRGLRVGAWVRGFPFHQQQPLSC
jgi:hypothetical protein